MILIALGSNLPGEYGSSEEALEEAKRALSARGIIVERCSGTWLTEPVPASDHPWYRNAVACVRTDLAPGALLDVLQGIECEFGRERTAERNAPRVLDLDIIAHNDEIYESENLTLPHPRMHERAFVLCPLREVAPEWIHPVLKQSVDELIEKLSEGHVVIAPEGEAV